MPPSVSFLAIGVIIMSMALDLGSLLVVIGWIAIPLISALITGKLAGGKGAAFGAWLLISILSAAIIGIVVYLNIIPSIMSGLDGMVFLGIVLLLGGINGIFYGAFAQLMSSDDLY